MTQDPRKYAKDNGISTYMGEPCPNGHKGERYTKSGYCKECQRLKLRKWRGKKKKEQFPNGQKPWKQCADGHKVCTMCREEKLHAEFGVDRRSSDGLQPSCRDCNRLAKHKRYWEDPEESRRKQREYYFRNPDVARQINKRQRLNYPERIRERKRKEYLKNREDPNWQEKQKQIRRQNRERKRQYDQFYRKYVMDTEKARRKSEEWRKNNPEKRKAVILNYTARRRSWKESGASASEVSEWESNQNKVCYWCNEDCSEDYHVDHFHPLSRGGEHELHNLVIACPSCNLRKSARDPYEFASMVGKTI